jgi:predicted permease
VLLWQIFFEVLLPILAMVGVGWQLDRRAGLDLSTLIKLNLYLFVPAFIFHQVVSSQLDSTLVWKTVLFTVCIVIGMGGLSLLAGRLLRYRREETRALQLATMFYNSGNYGVPLMTLAYPGLGPLLQVFIVLTQNISTFTLGHFLAASAETRGWRAILPMLRQVSLWAVGCAILVRAFKIPVQEWRWFWVPLDYFHAALVGVALVTLGAQLSHTTAQPHYARLSCALLLRLIGGPLLAAALVPLFGFRGETAAIMILSSSFPTAVNTALIAHEFKADSAFAASAVFYSTLLSMITVTVLIAILAV